ncbi:uncharacterized protein F4812DRAFT_468142 [Daldinia caldariorum]|uniref:uncharacterized protein n=1 Tax=Daldinia caldariorum TaxID=326644 RepID=UPI00200787B0|nr:uncharacterized protein F4812DRAFT_468142 [Daldinia caldariorum]KAI1464227.1 hypothetical protein F4812DRAFT_468142 [Daldinia caldariorum]
MARNKSASLLGLATLLLQVSAYKLIAYKGENCGGDVQQTIEDTIYGDVCHVFKDKAASVKVEGSDDGYQWVFFNNYCSNKAQVGSFLGNNCITMGATKIKGVGNIIPEGSPSKRASAGIVKTWKNNDCSGTFSNEKRFVGENIPEALNNVGSIMVTDVPDADITFACTDTDCHVENQVTTLENGKCANVEGKGVKSAMVIGVPTPPGRRDTLPKHRYTRNLILEARELGSLQTRDGVECDANNGADYQDALKLGDDYQGSNGLACCCHIAGGPSTESHGSAKASISDDIRCPTDPSGQPPPPSACPMNCNTMRSIIYAIATKCKTDDGKTGGSYKFAGGEVKLFHS